MRIFAAVCLISLIFATAGSSATLPPQWWVHAQEKAQEHGYELICDEKINKLGILEKDFILIDARPKYEYNAGHISGAISFEFDLSNSSSQRLQRLLNFEKLTGADKSIPIVFYCRSIR